jgi:hypothetical protein
MHESATENPLLIWQQRIYPLLICNGLSIAKFQQRIFRCCQMSNEQIRCKKINNDKSAPDFCHC